MKALIYSQLAMTVLGAVAVGVFASLTAGLSFAGGAGIVLLNFAALVFGWPRILAKKQIALGTFAIVIKFAILGWILYLVTHSSSVRIGWFAFGMTTVFPSILFAAFLLRSEASDPTELDHGAEEVNGSTL